MRIAQVLSAALFSALASTALAADPAASQPASLSGDTELFLGIMEAHGKIDDLKQLKPADLEKVEQTMRSKDTKPLATRFQAISEMRTSLDIHSVARCTIGMSMPVVLSEPSTAPARRRGVPISYQEVGSEIEVTPTPGGPPEGVRFQLMLKVGVPYPGQRGRVEKTTYEKTVDVVPGKTAIVLLDDAPVATGFKDSGQLRFVRLTLGPRRASRFSRSKGAPPPSKQPATSNGRGELDCIQLSASVEKLAALDLPSITADSPSAADLLKRLSAVGDALQTSAGLFSFDSAAGTTVSYGASLPTVTDINISARREVTPSVTYKDVGSLLRTTAMNWTGRGPEAKATTQIQFQNSSIAITSLEVGAGVKLPAFSQFKIEQSQEFRTGVPEYFVIRGPSGPGTTETSATLLIVRLVFTAP